MRKLINDPFLKSMTTANAKMAMNSNASMGFTRMANKDITKAALSGDWSELIIKAQKRTTNFRNTFYK